MTAILFALLFHVELFNACDPIELNPGQCMVTLESTSDVPVTVQEGENVFTAYVGVGAEVLVAEDDRALGLCDRQVVFPLSWKPTGVKTCEGAVSVVAPPVVAETPATSDSATADGIPGTPALTNLQVFLQCSSLPDRHRVLCMDVHAGSEEDVRETVGVDDGPADFRATGQQSLEDGDAREALHRHAVPERAEPLVHYVYAGAPAKPKRWPYVLGGAVLGAIVYAIIDHNRGDEESHRQPSQEVVVVVQECRGNCKP